MSQDLQEFSGVDATSLITRKDIRLITAAAKKLAHHGKMSTRLKRSYLGFQLVVLLENFLK